MEGKQKAGCGMAVILLSCLACMAQQHPGFHVEGRFLYDRCGEQVVLRGINKMIYWVDIDGLPSYPEIAKTGANCVRIQWVVAGTAAELDTAITNCINHQMIPMIELHNATGNWSRLQEMVDYWVRSDIVAVIQKHEAYLLVNIANECGDWQVTDDQFKSGYRQAVTRMRNAGIHTPLVIDGTDWGKNIDIMQRNGAYLIGEDPDHNLIFSVHMWWPLMWGYSAQRVIDEINESVQIDLPLIVGEFGNKWEQTTGGEIPYLTILEQCELNDIGYLPWSWGPGNNPQTWLDMTTNSYYDTLFGWGLQVAVTDANSIANTSVRPYSVINGTCRPVFGDVTVSFQPPDCMLICWPDNFDNELGFVVHRKPYQNSNDWYQVAVLPPDTTCHLDCDSLHGLVSYTYRVGVILP